jgi:hypothetical protein
LPPAGKAIVIFFTDRGPDIVAEDKICPAVMYVVVRVNPAGKWVPGGEEEDTADEAIEPTVGRERIVGGVVGFEEEERADEAGEEREYRPRPFKGDGDGRGDHGCIKEQARNDNAQCRGDRALARGGVDRGADLSGVERMSMAGHSNADEILGARRVMQYTGDFAAMLPPSGGRSAGFMSSDVKRAGGRKV